MLVQMELENLNKTWVEVATVTAAHTLIDPKKRRYLEPFMGAECSARQAAETLGVKLTAMLYQIGRLQSLGLLRVTRQQVRRGRPVKLYGATASRFFVPFEATRAESLPALLAELEADFRRYFVKNLVWAGLELARDWGFTVYRDGEGVVVQNLVPRDEQSESVLPFLLSSTSPALWASSSFLKLDAQTAKALQRDIGDLLTAYQAKQVPGKHTHLVQFGLTPLKPA